MSRPSPLIGVPGGMGPLATVDFLRKVIVSTPATCDQEHVPMLVWNVPQIPDRQNLTQSLFF
jgi:aspartate racemase